MAEDVDGLALQTRFLKSPGAAPGLDADKVALAPRGARANIACIDYAPGRCAATDVGDVESFLASRRPDWVKVRWINVDSIADSTIIAGLAKKYDLHPLAIEDLLHVPQRPKVDLYGEKGSGHQARLFIILQMVELKRGRLTQDQTSIFLGHNTVITFQQSPGDVWGPIRQRLQTEGSRLRINDAGFLAYSLIDAVVDQCFPILERYGDELEELERKVLLRPGQHLIGQAHKARRELMLLRRAIWPMRELVNTLAREPHECLGDTTRLYLRDVYDHVTQIIDIIETYREIGTGITETHMAAISNRLNEIMKVLTLISVCFIPATFISSVFGMNFERFPWKWPYAFPAFLVGCVLLFAGMWTWFRRRGWI
jgi:magnesium transporter